MNEDELKVWKDKLWIWLRRCPMISPPSGIHPVRFAAWPPGFGQRKLPNSTCLTMVSTKIQSSHHHPIWISYGSIGFFHNFSLPCSAVPSFPSPAPSWVMVMVMVMSRSKNVQIPRWSKAPMTSAERRGRCPLHETND